MIKKEIQEWKKWINDELSFFYNSFTNVSI